jgi:hypothetical protein
MYGARIPWTLWIFLALGGLVVKLAYVIIYLAVTLIGYTIYGLIHYLIVLPAGAIYRARQRKLQMHANEEAADNQRRIVNFEAHLWNYLGRNGQ